MIIIRQHNIDNNGPADEENARLTTATSINQSSVLIPMDLLLVNSLKIKNGYIMTVLVIVTMTMLFPRYGGT